MSATLIVAIVIVMAIVMRPEPGADDIRRRRLPGDIAGELRVADVEDLPVHARAYLASDRPWRAAHIMRRYFDEVDKTTDDMRVLAGSPMAAYYAAHIRNDLPRTITSGGTPSTSQTNSPPPSKDSSIAQNASNGIIHGIDKVLWPDPQPTP